MNLYRTRDFTDRRAQARWPGDTATLPPTAVWLQARFSAFLCTWHGVRIKNSLCEAVDLVSIPAPAIFGILPGICHSSWGGRSLVRHSIYWAPACAIGLLHIIKGARGKGRLVLDLTGMRSLCKQAVQNSHQCKVAERIPLQSCGHLSVNSFTHFSHKHLINTGDSQVLIFRSCFQAFHKPEQGNRWDSQLKKCSVISAVQ